MSTASTTSVGDATWSHLPPAVPLGLTADAARLGAEVDALSGFTWRPNRPVSQDGLGTEDAFDWKIIPLRSPTGSLHRTDPGGAGLEDHLDTAALDRCPYHAEVLAQIPAPLHSVRLMALGPGAETHEHRDGRTNFPWGSLRLHIPVVTQPGAELIVGGQTYHWEAGQLWYADFDRLHIARNRSPRRRIHLVVDCVPTPALMALFPDGFRAQLPWADVLMARREAPLPTAEQERLRCELDIPATFPDWSDDSDADPADSLPGAVDIIAGRLTLCIAGEPRFGLVHIGNAEFRLQGWTDERTLVLDLERPDPTARFRVRCGRSTDEQIRKVRRPDQDRKQC
ncbi:aspartyl/asparaginyl beta-hydroxylase domain-containing protein [Streptomyces sp. 15-116A]|uniref:aspartyl/asparaginyl beta-hydroxylase domain-containing protein n=1 Tax=Streptomyces sp. 15-116A TaxID=2259035 RepID=UPI0021B1FF69|nr:aspartyl/asparaginyl beta-hydroxylase domain-containing protein [Streptomyces sp. 15-116A]MCT7350805.1 aspartyl/asparaginyl beta-hydroxylase domain-containing protein [Streptomyces sp. 15-116A]